MTTKLKVIFCAIFRHSNIETCCFGYISCGRCGTQVGDTIGGSYKNQNTVGDECGCKECQLNYSRLTFLDKFLSPKPKWLGTEPGVYKAQKRAGLDKALAAMKAARAVREAAEN